MHESSIEDSFSCNEISGKYNSTDIKQLENFITFKCSKFFVKLIGRNRKVVVV